MIIVEPLAGIPMTEQRVEVVERKGTGHPDQICDSVAEAVSVALSQEYLRRFGAVLHHNVDKSLLAAGRVEKSFGGGQVVQPMELIIGDRATFAAAGQDIAVADIAVATTRQWFRDHIRFLDPERHLQVRLVLAPGSAELVDIFARSGQILGANDTSAAIGYYPLTPTERLVLDLEQHLNAASFKERWPETGEDVKVMAVRIDDNVELTVAMPLLAPFVPSEDEYFQRKETIRKEMVAFVAGLTSLRTTVTFNALDLPGRGPGGVYLSLTGTSAEDADSGQVGRGNRVNGLISLNRPLGTEAAAGKNAVSHVGKIYNVLAHRIARQVYETVEGIREVQVLLMNRIGVGIDRPRLASVGVLLERGQVMSQVTGKVEEVLEREFARMGHFCLALARGEYSVS